MAGLLVPVLFTGSLGMDAGAMMATNKTVQEKRAVQQELIIRYKDGRTALLTTEPGRTIQSATAKNSWRVQQIRPEQLAQLQTQYLRDPAVAYVEPNYVYKKAETRMGTQDPHVDEQWGLAAVGAEAAWKMIGEWTGPSADQVTVAVLDTGVDAEHPDLAGRVLPNGYNTIDGNTDTTDRDGHGTHVAGIIAAQTDNGEGVAGVTGRWPIRILPVKVLNDDGEGTALSIAEGITKAVEAGADVINMSLGGPGRSRLVEEAIRQAVAQGVVVAVAAGNEYDNAEGYYPAGYAEPIAVASVDESLASSDFSNYGSPIDIAAPGEEILSTVPGGDYERFSGTSMATPFVAGAAALLKLVHPDWDQAEIRSALERSALDLDKPGFDAATGYGLLQLPQALEYGEPRALQILAPNPGERVWEEITFRVNVLDRDVTRIRLEDEKGNILLEQPAGPGLHTFTWDTRMVANGTRDFTLKALDADGQLTGAAETLRLRIDNETGNGTRLRVIGPDGQAAYGASVRVLRYQRDRWGDWGYLPVMQAYTNDQGLLHLPKNVQLPDEKYMIVVQHLEGGADYDIYTTFREWTVGAEQLTLDLRRTEKVEVTLEQKGSRLTGGEFSVEFIPLFHGEKGTAFTVTAEADEEGELAVYLPEGEYVGYAKRLNGEHRFFLEQRFTVEADSQTLVFDLDQAEPLHFSLPVWADAAIWYPDTGSEYAMGIPVEADSPLLVSPMRLKAYWLDLVARGEGWDHIYSLYAPDGIGLAEDRIISADGTAIVKVGQPDEPEELFQPDDWISLDFEVHVSDGLVLNDMITSYEPLDMTDQQLIRHKGKVRAFSRRDHLYTTTAERLFSEEEPGVRILFVNRKGKTVAADTGWDDVKVPPDLPGGTYTLYGDFSALPFEIKQSRHRLRDINTISEEAWPVTVISPDQPFETLTVEAFDPGTKRKLSSDSISFAEDQLYLEDLRSGRSYLLRAYGTLVDGSAVFAERYVRTRQQVLELDLRKGMQQVAIALEDAVSAELIKNGGIVSEIRLNQDTPTLWIDPGKHDVVVTQEGGEFRAMYHTTLNVTKSTRKWAVRPNIRRMKQVQVDTKTEADGWMIGVKPVERRSDEEGLGAYTLFAYDEARPLYLSPDKYEFLLIKLEDEDETTNAVIADAALEKTGGKYRFRWDEKYRLEVKMEDMTYRKGQEVEANLRVVDRYGNRMETVLVISQNPADEISAPLRLTIDRGGEAELFAWDQSERLYFPIAVQEAYPSYELLSSDGKTLVKGKADSWEKLTFTLPRKLDDGTYRLQVQSKYPFRVKKVVRLEVDR